MFSSEKRKDEWVLWMEKRETERATQISISYIISKWIDIQGDASLLNVGTSHVWKIQHKICSYFYIMYKYVTLNKTEGFDYWIIQTVSEYYQRTSIYSLINRNSLVLLRPFELHNRHVSG